MALKNKLNNPYKKKFIILNPLVKREKYRKEYDKLLDQFPELKTIILRNRKNNKKFSLRKMLSTYNSISEIPSIIQEKLQMDVNRIGNPGSTTFIMYVTDNRRDNCIYVNKYYPILTFDTGEEFVKVTAIQGFYSSQNLIDNWKIPFGRYFKVKPILGRDLIKMDIPFITRVIIGDFDYNLMDRKYILPFELTNQIYEYRIKKWKHKGKEFRKVLRNFRSLMAILNKSSVLDLVNLSPLKREDLVMQIFRLIWYGRKNYQKISKDIEEIQTFYFPQVQEIFQEIQNPNKQMVKREIKKIRHSILGDYI